MFASIARTGILALAGYGAYKLSQDKSVQDTVSDLYAKAKAAFDTTSQQENTATDTSDETKSDQKPRETPPMAKAT